MDHVMRLFKNVLFWAMVLFMFSACSEDEFDERKEIFSKEYQLADVVWGKMVEDETTCRTFEESQEVIAEKNGTKYSATIYNIDRDTYKQRSQFFSDDSELFTHLVGTNLEKISVPSKDAILSSDISWHVTGGEKVPLSLETYNYDIEDYSSHQFTVEVPFKVQGTSVIREYEMAATYRAFFKEVGGNGMVEITGKWKGVCYVCEEFICEPLI